MIRSIAMSRSPIAAAIADVVGGDRLDADRGLTRCAIGRGRRDEAGGAVQGGGVEILELAGQGVAGQARLKRGGGMGQVSHAAAYAPAASASQDLRDPETLLLGAAQERDVKTLVS
jgi:hypothetical protein